MTEAAFGLKDAVELLHHQFELNNHIRDVLGVFAAGAVTAAWTARDRHGYVRVIAIAFAVFATFNLIGQVQGQIAARTIYRGIESCISEARTPQLVCGIKAFSPDSPWLVFGQYLIDDLVILGIILLIPTPALLPFQKK